MNMKQYQWALISLGLAVSVGCTFPFLVGADRDSAVNTTGDGSVITDPQDVSSSLPIFLPPPGQNPNPGNVLEPNTDPGLGIIGTENPQIDGPLPVPTATPFLSDISPNIDNQISPNGLPVLRAEGNLTTQQPIVESIIKGRVLGYNPVTQSYEALSNAQVRIDESLAINTDANGFYETSQEFDRVVTISAGHENYVASTVSDVPPGVNRDIHLNPLNERLAYRQDSFRVEGSLTNLSQNGRRPRIVFADGNNSFSSAANLNRATGRYDLDVRLTSERASTTGTLFASVDEQIGKLSVVTQYGYSPNVSVPVEPPTPFPTATPSTDSDSNFVPLKPTDLLLSFNHLVSPEAFGEINLNLSAEAGSQLQGIVVHVYMNLPNGGRVLVARYTDNTSSSINQTIRVPRVANTSFTVAAHTGTSLNGSDMVIPSIQIGSSITRKFLPRPVFNQIGTEDDFSDTNKTVFESSDTSPEIGWNSQKDVNSFQLDIQGDHPENFRWEAYTLGTSITYPDFGENNPLSLQEGTSYRLQLLASDFDIGTFNILNQAAPRQASRAERLYSAQNNSFNTKLLNPSLANFAQGYRVSYSSIQFVTE